MDDVTREGERQNLAEPHSRDEKRQMGDESEESAFTARLLVSPAYGKAESRQHWQDTLEQPVRFTGPDYVSKLTSDQLRRLLELHPDRQARFWGARPSHDRKMEPVTTGDVVLFTGQNHIRAIGEIGAIFRNRSFADAMWPPEKDAQSWHTVYSLRQFTLAEVPYETLNALLGYKSNMKYAGQLVLSGEKARAAVDGLFITTRTALEEAGAETPPAEVREMPVEQQHTRSTMVDLPARQVLYSREESALATEFCGALTNTKSSRFSSAAGICDIYLDGPEGRELIEAKSHVGRHHVREALAQLLDYARYVPDRVGRLAALFPQRLAGKECDLLHHYGIDVIHRVAPGVFERLPAPNKNRELMRGLWERR